MSVDDYNAALKKAVGLTIKHIEIVKADPDELIISFEETGSLALFDDGQCCCEARYLHTDDDLSAFVGAKFVGIDEREVRFAEDEYEVHEICFLLVNTSMGTFTVETHNEHNGYYGGFAVEAKWYDGGEKE